MMRKTFVILLLACGAVLTTFPFLWMISTSFKPLREAAQPTLDLWPNTWQWDNFAETLRAAPFGRYFANSFTVSITVTAAVVFTSLTAGYAFARLQFRGSGLIFGLVMATMMVPFEVTLIPNFVLIHNIGWYNTYAALIVPWCASAFSIFLMRQAFMTLPNDYFDAAKIDGCGHLRFLAYIALPLVKPAAVTVGLFAFLGSYNSLLWPLVVTGGGDMSVVQVGLTVFASSNGTKLNLLMCAATIVILPTVALYFAAQRYFLESSMGAGIKG